MVSMFVEYDTSARPPWPHHASISRRLRIEFSMLTSFFPTISAYAFFEFAARAADS